MKIPVCITLLVALMLLCALQAAVLAKEATVVQFRLHSTYEDTLPPENPFGSRLLHFKGLLDLIREATVDQNIAALYLKSEAPRLPPAQRHPGSARTRLPSAERRMPAAHRSDWYAQTYAVVTR
jgi:hypothetical protein